MPLSEHEQRAIDALLPLVKCAGSLHEHNILPEFLYETPAHLAYAHSQLAKTWVPEWQASEMFQRMPLISGTLIFEVRPIHEIRRSRGGGGPNVKSHWTIKQYDSMKRVAHGYTYSAMTGDENRIYGRFFRIVYRMCNETPGMIWWRGCNFDMHSGRFYPIPKTRDQVDHVIDVFRQKVEYVGFNLIVQFLDVQKECK